MRVRCNNCSYCWEARKKVTSSRRQCPKCYSYKLTIVNSPEEGRQASIQETVDIDKLKKELFEIKRALVRIAYDVFEGKKDDIGALLFDMPPDTWVGPGANEDGTSEFCVLVLGDLLRTGILIKDQ